MREELVEEHGNALEPVSDPESHARWELGIDSRWPHCAETRDPIASTIRLANSIKSAKCCCTANPSASRVRAGHWLRGSKRPEPASVSSPRKSSASSRRVYPALQTIENAPEVYFDIVNLPAGQNLPPLGPATLGDLHDAERATTSGAHELDFAVPEVSNLSLKNVSSTIDGRRTPGLGPRDSERGQSSQPAVPHPRLATDATPRVPAPNNDIDFGTAALSFGITVATGLAVLPWSERNIDFEVSFHERSKGCRFSRYQNIKNKLRRHCCGRHSSGFRRQAGIRG